MSPAAISLVYCCFLLEYPKVCGFLTVSLFTGEGIDETGFPGHRVIKEQEGKCHCFSLAVASRKMAAVEISAAQGWRKHVGMAAVSVMTTK